MNQKRSYISEIIGNDYKEWKSGESILISSGTNTGKTTFCTILALYAKQNKQKILYLVSRKTKQQEQTEEIRKKNEELDINLFSVLTIITYQKLETMISNNSSALKEYTSYRYIFCDECHYFTDDIAIKDSTPSVSENWIRAQKYPTKIYASATATEFFAALIKKNNIPQSKIYNVSKDFNYIKRIYFFKRIQLTQLIDKILFTDPDSKLLVYVNTTEQMNELHDIYGEDYCDYLCSKNSHDKLLNKICNYHGAEKLYVNGKFQIKKSILFATKTIDVGINIYDDTLRHIICEIPDINTIIQCFGRKRPIDKYDTCTFYIEDKTIMNFVPYKNEIQRHLNQYEEYKQNPEKFIIKHREDRNLNKHGSVFYQKPGTSEINIDYTLLHNYRQFIKFYNEIKSKGYMQTIIDNIGDGFKDKISGLPPLLEEKDMFLEYIKTLVGVFAYAEEKSEIKKKINEKMIETGYKNKTCGINVINSFLDKLYGNQFDKRFVSRKDQRRTINNIKNPHYKQMYWILE